MPYQTAARTLGAIAAALAIALVLVVTVSFEGGVGSAGPTAATADSGAPHEIDIALDEWAITPSDIEVPAATPLVFHISNDGDAEHDFVIAGVAESSLLAPGEAESLEVGPLEAGSYEVTCEVAGHAPAGMEGTLVVGGDAEPAAAGEDGEEAGASSMTPEEMAAHHDDFEFPTETEGQGNQPLEPELDGDTLVYELTATHVEWETEPGDVREGMAFNEQIPGPRLDVEVGDDVRIVLHNELEVPTALHFHHIAVPNEMDGVPGITQDSVLPGESFTYEFTVPEESQGSHMYHSHFDSAEQVPRGLLGTLVVHGDDEPDVDHDIVMVLNDGPLGYTINGKGFPATEPIVVDEGDTLRVRYYNEGLQIHPMHLHGIRQEVIAKDGNFLPEPRYEDNVLVAPGDRVDVLVEATHPGVWAWHCHVLSHAEGPDGMFGMVTALIVEES